MITDQDITKLKEVFATKEDLQSVDGDLQGLKEIVQTNHQEVMTMFDRLFGKFESKSIEDAAGTQHLLRHDRHLHQVAGELNIDLVE